MLNTTDCNDDLRDESSNESVDFGALNEVLAALEAQPPPSEREEILRSRKKNSTPAAMGLPKETRPSIVRTEQGSGKIMPHVEIRKKEDCKPMSSNVRRMQNTTRLLISATKMLSHVNANYSINDDEVPPDSALSHNESERSRQEYAQESRGSHRNLLKPSVSGRSLLFQRSSYRLSTSCKAEADDSMVEGVQYRLQSKREKNSLWHKALAVVGISTGDSGIYDDSASESGLKICGIAPNTLVTTYLHWAFRSSFLAVLFSAAVGFFILTLIFAVVIYLAGSVYPECITCYEQEFGSNAGFWKNFADAYTLSWTTFATVGFGRIYPSTSAVEPQIRKCTGITILCTLESFVGVLFGSLCGAVLHGKVARVRSQAQVIFSDPIVIRYGSGVMNINEDDDDDRSHLSGKTSKSNPVSGGSLTEHENSQLPCPLLEFRVVNRLHGVMGGEIMEATMNIVACIDKHQVGEEILKAARQRSHRKRKGKFVDSKPSTNKLHLPSNGSGTPTTIMETRPLKGGRNLDDSLTSLANIISERASEPKSLAFDEDLEGHLSSKRIFIKVDIESPDHPFFQRVWLARHTLNQNSPLLTEAAREAVKLNGNFWPAALNNHESVRASVQFDQILVSLSGTSNVDASRVYSQKVYLHDDINVGYRFVNMLFRDKKESSLKVDISVLNDVFEQEGGGGEPFKYFDTGNDAKSMLGSMVFL